MLWVFVGLQAHQCVNVSDVADHPHSVANDDCSVRHLVMVLCISCEANVYVYSGGDVVVAVRVVLTWVHVYVYALIVRYNWAPVTLWCSRPG